MQQRRRWIGAVGATLGAGLLRWSLARLLFMGGAVAAEAPAQAKGWPVLLAEDAPELHHLDLSAYLVSEKLDGVRAIWDGQTLRFRSGGTVAAPASWLKGLPDQALDGELWMGRGRFESVSGLTRRLGASEADWVGVRYEVFEAPGAAGSFEDRRALLESVHRARGSGVWRPVAQRRVSRIEELQAWLDQVVRQGGEGLMLHRADAPYVTGRRMELLKLKPWQDDEATVIAHVPGQGRHAGRLGALRVRDPQGREFSLGSGLTDAERESPPAPGTVVTYRFRGRTSRGLPRFATYWRMAIR